MVVVAYFDKRIRALQEQLERLEGDLLGVVVGDIPDKYLTAMERLKTMRGH